MKNKLGGNRGALTVEASIVFTTTFLVTLALIYAGMLLYQKSYLQSISDKAAQRGAAIWNNPSKDMLIGMVGKDNLDDAGLYWRIDDGEAQIKTTKIENYINYYLNSSMALGNAKNIEVKVVVNDHIVSKRLSVSLIATYNNPIGSFLEIFRLKKVFTLSAVSEAVINEPAEFIRSTDFAVDTGKELDRKFLGGSVSQQGSQIKDTFTKMLSKLKDFLD